VDELVVLGVEQLAQGLSSGSRRAGQALSRPHRLPPAPADPGSRSGDLRIVGTALSFPHIHLPETSWFTQVLLYWDSTFALCRCPRWPQAGLSVPA
jgi:hypothetical protein